MGRGGRSPRRRSNPCASKTSCGGMKHLLSKASYDFKMWQEKIGQFYGVIRATALTHPWPRLVGDRADESHSPILYCANSYVQE